MPATAYDRPGKRFNKTPAPRPGQRNEGNIMVRPHHRMQAGYANRGDDQYLEFMVQMSADFYKDNYWEWILPGNKNTIQIRRISSFLFKKQL